jgi:hypothetical protein
MADVDTTAVVEATREWVERVVVGLNLCPFAKAVHVRGQIRYAVTLAKTPARLVDDLVGELRLLVSADPAQVETTLLIAPLMFPEFEDYNDFLDIAESLVDELDLSGVVQVASFHPAYRFAGTSKDAIENYTNRSPYPMFHLLREESVERAVTSYPDVADIPERNIVTMNRLGLEGWEALMRKK